MNKKLPAAVIFDWDNTLIDTFPLILESNNVVRRSFGLADWSDAEGRKNSRLAAKDMFSMFYGDRWQEAEKIFYDHIRAHHLTSLKVIAHADTLITHLAKAGVKLGVLSNKRGEILRREVEAVAWGTHFSVVLGPDDVGDIGKPDPAGLIAALTRLGIEKPDYSNTWYAGDTENDLKTANAAGVIPVFIENESMSDPADIALQRPKHSFKTCMDCLDYLKSLG